MHRGVTGERKTVCMDVPFPMRILNNKQWTRYDVCPGDSKSRRCPSGLGPRYWDQFKASSLQVLAIGGRSRLETLWRLDGISLTRSKPPASGEEAGRG